MRILICLVVVAFCHAKALAQDFWIYGDTHYTYAMSVGRGPVKQLDQLPAPAAGRPESIGQVPGMKLSGGVSRVDMRVLPELVRLDFLHKPVELSGQDRRLFLASHPVRLKTGEVIQLFTSMKDVNDDLRKLEIYITSMRGQILRRLELVELEPDNKNQ